MNRLTTCLASTLLALCFSSFLWSQTPTLELSRGRQGDFWSASLTGIPGAPGLLGLDLVPGPTMSGIGTLGLGLSSDFVVVPFTLDASGEATVSALPVLDPSTLGTLIYAQAGVQNLAAPFWIDLTSTETSRLRGPRYFFELHASGFANPQPSATIVAHEVGVPNALWSRSFPGGSTGDSMVFSAKHNLLLSSRVGLGMVQRLEALDGDTGATVFTVPGAFGRVWSSSDEDEVFGAASGALARISLQTGAVTASINLPTYAREFVEAGSAPSPTGYVISSGSVYSVDLVTNTLGPVLWQSSSTELAATMRISGTRLAILVQASTGGTFGTYSLHVYDITTGLPVAGSPVVLASASNGYRALAALPSTSGPTTYGVLTGATSPSVVTVEEGPLQVTNTSSPLPLLTMLIEASPEGAFWVTSGGGGVSLLDTSNFATLNVGPLLGATAGTGIIAPSPSDTANGVFATVPTSGMTVESFFLRTSPVTLPLSLGSVPRDGNPVAATSDR